LKQLKEKNLELEQIIKIDGLTELLNHKCILEKLEEEIHRAQRYDTSFSIIMFDIDNFKLINDNYGHQKGDEVLIQISKFLRNSLRNIDTIGRYGGEEFLIILPETNLQGAYTIAERLREGVSKIDFSKENLKITISGGIVEFINESSTDLIKKADKLLYNAKRNGRNRIESC
jgi:diguanylate cyclase (GGDEF)-like protein